MIRDLQDGKLGDQGRLAYVMDRIEKGRPIYDSDEQYVREKFRQLREEITRESEETPDVPQDRVAPPEPQPSVAPKDKPSKAWYVLSIFLGLLGGVIAFAALRKRNRGMAYKNLGVGVGITMILPMLVLGAYIAESGSFTDVFDSKPVPEYTDEEVRRQAVTIPYQFLMDQPEIHEDEIVYYKGELVQALPQLFGEYALRVKIAEKVSFGSDVIWVNYTPTSDEEKTWMNQVEAESNKFMGETEMIEFWGISKGLKEYTARLGHKITVPEVDCILIERLDGRETVNPNPEPQVTASGQPTASHTVSFSNIPAYVDKTVVERAAFDAVWSWNAANQDMDFTIVESDADVNISWTRYLPGSTLGRHSANVIDDGTRERHSITARLGIDDCHSDYQQFTYETLQYTITHELGHYLGLRHVDDKSHLMYSGALFNVDSAQVYDDLNLGIPHLERPEIATVAGIEVQSQIDALNADLEDVSMQRQELRDAGKSLDDNTDRHNDLSQRIQEMEDQLTCVNLA